jgi:hypothetical protein
LSSRSPSHHYANTPARALELGNVMGHYGARGHDVVDKYERAPGVTNLDSLDFRPDTGYGLIVSISTLQHIGFEEEVDDPDKPARVLEHLMSLLIPGGALLITFPLGYSPSLDTQVRAESLAFDQTRYLRRVSRDNRWAEVTLSDVSEARYGAPYPKANVLVIGTSTAAPSPLSPA